MKKKFAKRTAASLALILSFTIAALADIPSPQRSKTPPPKNEASARMWIAVRSEVKEPTLTIKRSALKGLRAALDEAEGLETIQIQEEKGFNFSRAQTVAGGAFFSMAFLFGGVWAFRKPGKSSKAASALLILIGVGAGAALVSANTPPPDVVSLTSRIFDRSTKAYGYASGNVKIKIVDEMQGSYDVLFEVPTGRGDKDSE